MTYEYERALERRRFVLGRVEAQPFRYRDDFLEWLTHNFAIWERFEREANAIYNSNRKHYSARTIGEYLRHETALKALGDEPFKISDWWWPHLARLYMAIYPEREGFFELRESPQRRVA